MGVHDLVIEGCFVNAYGIIHGEIGIDGGFITDVRRQGLRGEKRICTRGCLVFPGFIDIHVHLRDDGSHEWSYKEDFNTGARAAIHGGVTAVADMPNTPLPAKTVGRVKEKKRLASVAAIDVLFYGAVTMDNLGEIARMCDEVIAFKIYLCETTGGLYMDERCLPVALSVLLRAGMPLVIHCENQNMISAGLRENPETELSAVRYVLRTLRELKHGEMSPHLHGESAGENSATENMERERGRVLVNIAHVSVYDTVRLIRTSCGCADVAVCCEVTPHHLFFSTDDRVRDRRLNVYPPLRSKHNAQQLFNAFKRGHIDFLASDHAPHTAEEKVRDEAGIPNLDTYGSFAGWLIRKGVPPERIAAACSYNPARFLSLRDRGLIEKGMRADITVIDLKKTRRIRSDALFTKCGWSPFEGYELPSVKHTILKGDVKSEYDEVFC